MSDLLLPLLLVAIAGWWWLSRRSLVGSVPRTPETEAALAAAVDAVTRALAAHRLHAVTVQPVWAHGCPCVRVSLDADAQGQGEAALHRARAAAAQALEASVRSSPAFAAVRHTYVGEQGLHWHPVSA